MKTFLLILTVLLFNSNCIAAISFVASVTDKGNDDKSSLIVPILTQAGDVLITQVAFRNTIGSDGVSTPSGWTLIAPQDNESDIFQSVYYKVATLSDAGTSYEWDFDGFLSRRYILGMSVYRGVDNSNPIAVEGSAITADYWGSLTAPSITTTQANSMLVVIYTTETGDHTLSTPSGMTEIYDTEEHNDLFGLTAMSAYSLFPAIAATGTRVSSLMPWKIDDGIGHLLALNEGALSPTIINISTSCSSLATISVNFSEALNTVTAENINNYSLLGPSGSPISITDASLSSNVVTLTMASSLNDLTPYTLTVNNVENLSGNSIAANSSESFTLSCDLNCITDNFVGPGSLSSSWSVGNSSGSFGDPTIVSNGRLRLTDNSGDVSTVATLLNQFPGADNRIEIEFDYYGYAGNGADGIAVNFSDASISPSAGAFGGSLGYAQKTGINGFAGGWLGVGIDEYGNFSTSGEGRVGGNGSRTTDSVSLRGSGSGTSGYPFLTSTSSLSPGIDQSGSTANPGHRYRIVIDHTEGGGNATTSVERDTGSGYSVIIPSFNIFTANPSQAAVPANWVVSFTGSTGGSTNIHEIGDLKVCAAQPIQTFSQVDHYEISHATPGLTCEGSEVTITAHDSSHTDVTVLSDTSINVTTNPVVTNIVTSPVIMLAGTSSTTFYLQQTAVLNNIDIDVSDGSKTDDEGSSEDPRISFLDTAFRFYANGNNTDTTPITTQISGKPSFTPPNNQSLVLRAIRTNTDTGACEAGLTGPQTVDIAYRCINPVNCSATQLAFSANGVSSIAGTNNADGLIYTAADMTFGNAGNAGNAPFSINLADAGKIDLHARLAVAATTTPPNPAFVLTGSSNEFVVRPFAFELLFGANSTAVDATNGSKFISAGSNFPFQIRAVNWEEMDDSDEDGIVDIDAITGAVDDLSGNSVTPNFGNEVAAALSSSFSLSHVLDQPAPGVLPMGQPGTLTSSAIVFGGTGSDFNNGVTPLISASSPAPKLMSWSEVGIIDINASLNNYLSASGANIKGQANNIGRFYPHQFAMVSQSTTDSCGDFSYMNQGGISIEYVLQAQNASGDITFNYNGAFAKATSNLVAENNNDGRAYGRLVPSLAVSAVWANGTFDFDGNYSFSRSSVVDGPYSMLQVGVQLDDNDGDVSTDSKLIGLDMNADTSTVCTAANCNAKYIDDPTPDLDIRFGQLKLSNVFGPETFALDMSVQTEYFDGTNFIVNGDDSCTNLLVSNPPLVPRPLSWTPNLDVGETTPSLPPGITSIIAGKGIITFSAAGLGNEGSVIFDYEVGSWLKTENTGDGNYTDNPFAKITFGQFRGNDRMIYWREVIRQ